MTTGLSSPYSRLCPAPDLPPSGGSVRRGKPARGAPSNRRRPSAIKPLARWTPSPSRSCVVKTRVASRPSGQIRRSASCSRPRTPSRCRQNRRQPATSERFSRGLLRIYFAQIIWSLQLIWSLQRPVARATAPAPGGPRNRPVQNSLRIAAFRAPEPCGGNRGNRPQRTEHAKAAPDRAPEDMAGGFQRACRTEGIEASCREQFKFTIRAERVVGRRDVPQVPRRSLFGRFELA